MGADSIQRAIDEDLVPVLYAQDPIAFFTHWFSIAVLASLYWNHVPAPHLFFACFAFYALANCAGLALWIWNRRTPAAFSPRGWIRLHALRGLLLYGAPGLSIWFAFHVAQPELPLLHTVLLVTLAAGVFMSNGFEIANFLTAIPVLLLPAIVMHAASHTLDRTVLALVLAFFFGAVNVYALSYRKLFRQVVEARIEQQRLAESLAEQKQVAEEANLAKTRFFAAASHDLRQPLHAIGLLAAAFNDGTASLQQVRTAEHIARNVESLSQLFNQVLDLARLESGVTQVMRMNFRLAELFERIDSQYRPLAAQKGLALRIAPTGAIVHGDPVLLERVLSNLVSNAVRYTEQGAIWIGLRRGGREAGGFVEVRDSGIGIAQAEQEQIFEEFYQVANPQRDARQGHGLGLPTVRRLVTLLGGELRVRSAPGRGSVFRFSVRGAAPGESVASLNEAAGGDAVSVQGRRVLCIDDDPSILTGLASLLGRWGCIVRGAPDETQALRIIEEGFRPDALLCDYQLANHRTGAAALIAVRAALVRCGEPPTASLLITGDMASAELESLVAQGIPVLHKPVAPARLRRALELQWREACTAGEPIEIELPAAGTVSGAIRLPPQPV